MRRVLLYVVAIILFAGGGIFLAMQLSAYLDHGGFRGLLIVSGATPMALGAYILYEDIWRQRPFREAAAQAPTAAASLPSVGQLLVAVFGISRTKNSELNQRWITMSLRVGSQLPQSLLSSSIQRLGEVDLVCRTLENELVTQPTKEGDIDFRPNYLSVLSEWWIGSAYDVCYTLRDRKIISDAVFLRLADELRMIRVQIEKYEVPSDRGLTEPLHFSPTHLRPDDVRHQMHCDSLRRCVVEAPAHRLG
jgi:hypothetical protein